MQFFRNLISGLQSRSSALSMDDASRSAAIAALGSFTVVAAGTLLTFLTVVLLSRILGLEAMGI